MNESHVCPLKIALETSKHLIQMTPELHDSPSHKDLALGSIALHLRLTGNFVEVFSSFSLCYWL